MEKIDLSTNAKAIELAYLKVVRNEGINYVVYSVDKAFVVTVTETGLGDLAEFIECFTDGQVQFGLARVKVPGSDVHKNLLLGWCPDNAPSKARLSFASNFADISNVLNGYHVQVTARDQDDLDVDELLSRVSAAAGARYSVQGGAESAKPITSKPIAAKPITPSSAKPSFVPKSTGNPINVGKSSTNESPIIKPKPAAAASISSVNDADDWAGEKEIEERDFSEKPLEDVPSAYKPTKVDIDELRKQKSDTVSSQPKASKPEPETKEPPKPQPKPAADDDDKDSEPQSFQERMKAFKNDNAPSDGRLTSLPKPKINNSVASRFSPAANSGPSFGAAPSFSKQAPPKPTKSGSAGRDFASENGKTPAQIWAEKRGKYKTVPQDDGDAPSTPAKEPEPEPEPKAEPQQVNELAERFAQKASMDEEETKEESPDDFEEESSEEPPKQEPTIIRPSGGAFPPPPARNLPPRVEPKEEEAPPAPPAAEPEPEPEPESKEPEPEPATPSEPEPESASKPKGSAAVAEYAYEKDEDNEIGFDEGDVIVEIDFVDEDWWSGKHSKTGEVGLFPASYVVLKEGDQKEEASAPAPSEAEQAPPAVPARNEPKNDKPTAVAEFAYEKDEDNEISFEEGDAIVDIEFVDEDWWSGKHSKTGDTGLFPANYVKLAD